MTEIEYLGYIIKQNGDKSFVITKDRALHTCSSEKEARAWISSHKKMSEKSASLKKIGEDTILFSPPGEPEQEDNIIAMVNENPEEKYIRITSQKNGAPLLDIKNLDANEVIGLMRRAEYIITNIVLRNGTI